MESGEKIRVLVAESHTHLSHVLRRLLENHSQIEVVAEANTEKQALTWAVYFQPDLILVDGGSQSLDSFRTSLLLKTSLPKVKIVLIADEDSDDYRKAAYESGASACVAKYRVEKDLVGVIKSILK